MTVAAPLPTASSTFAFVFFGVSQADGSCATVVGVGDTIGSAGSSARRAVPIRVTRRGRGTAAVTVRVTGVRAQPAARTVTIPLPAPPRRPAQPRPGPSTGGLAGLAYLRLVSGSPGISQDRRVGYLFTGPRWVYRGTPENGMPSCSRRTAGPGADDDPRRRNAEARRAARPAERGPAARRHRLLVVVTR